MEGANTSISAYVYDENNQPLAGLELEWISDDPDIAVVNNGVITGVSGVKTRVRALYEELEEAIEVTIIKLSEVNLLAERTTLKRTESINLEIAGVLSNGEKTNLTGAIIEYFSCNPLIASVNENGVVTGNRPGTNTGSSYL